MSIIPFRADFVGSFLRPDPLKFAREQFKTAKIDRNDLLKVENEEVVKLVNKLVSLGFKDVSDGEFKRSMWNLDFQTSLLGVKNVTLDKPFMHTATNHIPLRCEGYEIVGKVEYNSNNPFFDSFIYLKSVTPDGITPKVTIPSPAMFLYFLFGGGVLPAGYKSNDELINDISVAYNLTIKHFYELGCRYLQYDDCMLPKIGGKPIPGVGSRPNPPNLDIYCVKIINDSLKDLPKDLSITIHLCRGNYCSDYFASNPYNVEMTQALAQLNVSGFFLEYDDERSGSFEALAKIAQNGKNQRIVLGLITSKRGTLEKEADIVARIDDAAKYFPKDRLALSAQCGFASCEEGNRLTEDEQWAKLALIVGIATRVWGSL